MIDRWNTRVEKTCEWVKCSDDSPTPNTFESVCGAMWYLGDEPFYTLENVSFCYQCGGKIVVKDGGE